MSHTPDAHLPDARAHLIDAEDKLLALRYRLDYLMGTLDDDDSQAPLFFTMESLHRDVVAVLDHVNTAHEALRAAVTMEGK